MIDVNGFKITGRQSLITFNEILSGPGAFPKGILVIICSTSSCVTSLMLNWSLRGIVLGTKGIKNLSQLELFIIVRIFPIVFCQTEQKNLLKSLAITVSSFKNVLTLAAFFGRHERMTFHKRPESLGFSFICLVTYSFSASLNSYFTWRFNNLYVDQALELLVFSASLRHSSLVCINTFISSVTKGLGRVFSLTRLIGACLSRIGLKSI